MAVCHLVTYSYKDEWGMLAITNYELPTIPALKICSAVKFNSGKLMTRCGHLLEIY